MKKLLIIFGILFGVLLAALVVIPLVVNVDQYRPRLVQKVNENIHGKLELGNMSLKLWGSIRVGIAGLKLVDTKDQVIVQVDSAHILVPWSSIFGGSPLLTLEMNQPEVQVIKEKNGKLNIMSLLKEDFSSGTSSLQKGTQQEPGKNKKSGDSEMPQWASNARIGIDLTQATFTYQDRSTQGKTQAKDLNLSVQDLSLSRKTEIKISGNLSSAQEDLFKIEGPFVFTVKAEPQVSEAKLNGMSIQLQGEMSDIDVQAGQSFHKKRGVPTRLEGQFFLSPDELILSRLEAQFFNAQFKADGKVTQLSTEGKEPEINLSFRSNEIDLSSWNELIPFLSGYSLKGTAQMDGFIQGVSSKLQYGANLKVKDLKAKNDFLKVEPVTQISVKIVTDRIEDLSAKMTAPGNDLEVKGSMLSFTAPQLKLKVTSSGLDFDQLVHLPELQTGTGASSAKASSANAAASGAVAPSGSSEDYDALLKPMRDTPMMTALTVAAEVDVKLIKFYDVAVTGLKSKISMKNLEASVDQAQATIFGGKIDLKASTAMKPKTPTYRFNASVNRFDLQKAVSSKLALFKNTIIGKMDLKIDGNGASFNPDAAIKNLKAQGSLKVSDAVFTAIDVGKMASEGINKALEKAGDKIPGLKDKKVKGLDKGETKYQMISTDFSLSGGLFSAPHFVAKAYPSQGLDIKGVTSIHLINEELKADWELSDPYNLTKARDISLSIAGREIPGILAQDGKVVTLPITVGCKYVDPCPSYGRLAEHFVKVALANTKSKAKSVVQEEVKEKAKEKIEDQAKEVGKKLLKGLFK